MPASRFLHPELVALSPTSVAFRAPAWHVTPGAVCASTAADAHAWLDGELAPGAAAGFGAHLEACAPCRAHVAALRHFLAAVRRPSARPPVTPAALRLRVRDLVARWHAHDAATHDAPAGDGMETVR